MIIAQQVRKYSDKNKQKENKNTGVHVIISRDESLDESLYYSG